MSQTLKAPITGDESNDIVFMLEHEYEITGMKILKIAADELRRMYDLFESIPAEVAKDDRPIVIRMGVVMKVCSKYFGIGAQELISARRDLKVMIPRHYTMYLAKELTNLSFPQIGVWFKRDHSTIVHAYQKMSEQVLKQPKVKRVVDEITAVCKKEALEERNRIEVVKKCQTKNPMLIRLRPTQKIMQSREL